MFIGRKKELEELGRFYAEDAFHFAVFYGRRRVGKTTLLNKFTENKETIYFTAMETTGKENLEQLSRRIMSVLMPQAPQIPFLSFYDAFDFTFKTAGKKRVVFIIDEYPYLAGSDKSVSSVLQAIIDRYQNSSRLFLILCGSSMSFMENQVLGYKSPLYGRRTSQFKIEPFEYYECAEMLPGFSNEEKINLYGICGGIPDYISRINNSLSVQKNTENLFFNTSGRLFEEPSNLLKQELKTPQTYNAIITAIASGATRLNDISSKAGIETSQCSNMLASLIGLGIIRKEYPAGENMTGKPSRKTIYLFADFMFRFWYRFVLPDLSRISMGYGKMVCAEIFEKARKSRMKQNNIMETYMGPVFEECAAQFLWRELGKGKFDFNILGRWWGSNPIEKNEEEIDLLAFGREGKLLFGECKWKNSLTGTETFLDLIRKSELFHDCRQKQYVLFSKTGFTAKLIKIAAQRKDTMLISINDMFDFNNR